MKSILSAAAALSLMAGTAVAAGDAVKGEKVSKVCLACHSFKDKTNKVGPYLMGVVGRPAGTVEGYSYSDANKKLSADGVVWDDATLDKYLENPKAFAPGTKMSFAGVKKPEQRADLIAYMATMK